MVRSVVENAKIRKKTLKNKEKEKTMAKRNRFINYFSLGELILLLGSWGGIVATFYLFRSGDYLSLFASLVGVTALVFNAKGNPIGQALIILFSLLYGFISYTCRYYGEMITYLAMTAPMAVAALVSWLKNQSEGKKGEVKINSIAVKEYLFAACLSLAVSVAFYFLLRFLNTANLLWSTISVFTSFYAAYLTFRRVPLFALAYAANDLVLIVLWIKATLTDRGYLSVLVCFFVFLINDIYGYINWKKLAAAQRKKEAKLSEKNFCFFYIKSKIVGYFI